jgi:hypothetical protein
MITYTNLIEGIKKCEGGIVTIITDLDIINDDLLLSIENDLQKNYKIERNILNVRHGNYINEKTVNFIDIGTKLDRYCYNLVDNDYVITIIIKEFFETSNTDISKYASNLILLLHNKKLKILKSRYLDLLPNNIVDIAKLTRKLKLINLQKIIK